MHGSSRGSNLLLLLPFLLTLLLMLLLAATPSAAEVLQGESPAVPANTSFTSSTPILDQEEDVEGVRWEEEGEHEEARDGLEKEIGEEVERIESEDSDNGGQGDADVDVEEMITYTGDVQDDSPLLLDEDFLPPVTSLDEERPETPMPEGQSVGDILFLFFYEITDCERKIGKKLVGFFFRVMLRFCQQMALFG